MDAHYQVKGFLPYMKRVSSVRVKASRYTPSLDGTGRIAAGSHEVFPCTIPTANA
ncbi:hypothetical protein PDR5_51690 [Pseudomonas sp. DR 5-09]|nr:hypothetical protein PDR5_51690 [Pseudomonas sp. DR 5-09]